MTLKERLVQYLEELEGANHEKATIELIRQLSGMFNKDQTVSILVLINQVTRLQQGDLDPETFKRVWKLK